MKCDFVEIPSTPVTRITADMRHVVSSKSTQDVSNFTDIYHGRKKFATEASNFAFLKLSNMEWFSILVEKTFENKMVTNSVRGISRYTS